MDHSTPNHHESPWLARWGKGERFDGGGQGDTYIVSDSEHGSAVMKVLTEKRAKDAKSRRRMFQEVSNLKILHSAGGRVPRIFDENVKDYENLSVPLFFVMERIKGQTLAQLLTSTKLLELPTAIALVLDLCKTFAIAFKERIYHRDIKPENLIVASIDPAQIFAVDFGLSFNEDSAQQITDVDETFDNKFITLPERRGPGENRRDPRSDITGLCAFFFYCITGVQPRNLRDSKNRPPHRWENSTIARAARTPAHQAQLNALFDRGLSYELENRFQTIEELEMRVRELLTDSPSVPRESIGIIAKRESATLRQTDRKTLIGRLRAEAKVVKVPLGNWLGTINTQLKDSLFALSVASTYLGYEEAARGEEIYRFSVVLSVQHHDLQVHIDYLITCMGNECTVLRMMYDRNMGTFGEPANTVVMRYDARSGCADPELIGTDLEVAVAAAIPRLRLLTQP